MQLIRRKDIASVTNFSWKNKYSDKEGYLDRYHVSIVACALKEGYKITYCVQYIQDEQCPVQALAANAHRKKPRGTSVISEVVCIIFLSYERAEKCTHEFLTLGDH